MSRRLPRTMRCRSTGPRLWPVQSLSVHARLGFRHSFRLDGQSKTSRNPTPYEAQQGRRMGPHTVRRPAWSRTRASAICEFLGISGRLDLNQRPFGPQPSGSDARCFRERPNRPMRPGFRKIWTDRTYRSVPKRYQRSFSGRDRCFHGKQLFGGGRLLLGVMAKHGVLRPCSGWSPHLSLSRRPNASGPACRSAARRASPPPGRTRQAER